MLRILTAASTLALATAPAFADGHAGNTGYALAEDGMTLHVMGSIAAPGEVQSFDLATEIDGIAWRPVTGELLGYTNGAIYVIDTTSGALTDVEAAFGEGAMVADGAFTAFDFNNGIDAVRAVSAAGDNLVYFPVGFGDNDERANTVIRVTDLAYVEGDAHEGTTPVVFANAYTNAINGATAESTFQYGLDAETNALISIANNAGTLVTVAPITVDGAEVDLAASGGFDIVSPEEGSDAAYAILQMEGARESGLYAIDLTTGAATALADLPLSGLRGFAVSMGM
jgi:hypothetical protein